MSNFQLTVQLATPSVPNFLTVTTLRAGTLDEALGGKGLQIDVADMADVDLDQVAQQWAVALKNNAAARRALRSQQRQQQLQQQNCPR